PNTHAAPTAQAGETSSAGAPEASAPPAPAGPAASDDSGTPSSAGSPPATAPPTASQPSRAPEPAPSSEPGELTADHVRRRWPEVLETLTTVKRTTWALISQHAQVVALDASTLQLGFSTGGLASAFSKGGHSEHVQRALAETLGLHVRVEPVVSDWTPPPQARPTSAAPAQGNPAHCTYGSNPSSPTGHHHRRPGPPRALPPRATQPRPPAGHPGSRRTPRQQPRRHRRATHRSHRKARHLLRRIPVRPVLGPGTPPPRPRGMWTRAKSAPRKADRHNQPRSHAATPAPIRPPKPPRTQLPSPVPVLRASPPRRPRKTRPASHRWRPPMHRSSPAPAMPIHPPIRQRPRIRANRTGPAPTGRVGSTRPRKHRIPPRPTPHRLPRPRKAAP